MKQGRKKRRVNDAPAPAAAPAASIRPKWIWFRASRDGRRKALEEFESLAAAGQAGLSSRIRRHLDGESRFKDVDHLGDGLYELRHRVGNNHYRVIFMRWGPHRVALTAFYKNQQQTPKADLDRARERARTWVQVFGAKPDE